MLHQNKLIIDIIFRIYIYIFFFFRCDIIVMTVRPRVYQSVFSTLKTLSFERLRVQRVLFFCWDVVVTMIENMADTSRISPIIIFHNNIMVVQQFDIVKKINMETSNINFSIVVQP